MNVPRRAVTVTFALLLICGSDRAAAFTQDEVARGRALFEQCVTCHSNAPTALPGLAQQRPLRGSDAVERLKAVNPDGATSVADLVDFVMIKMPASNPGSLSEQEAMALVAFILNDNGVPADGQVMDRAVLETTEVRGILPGRRSRLWYGVGGVAVATAVGIGILLRKKTRTRRQIE